MSTQTMGQSGVAPEPRSDSEEAFATKATAMLDSCEAIWQELLASVLQDSAALSDEKRAALLSIAGALDSCFSASLNATRENLSASKFLGDEARLAKIQARCADATLALYDSLARAFEALKPPRRSARLNGELDYERLLKDLSESRGRAHRFSVRSAYQSRSAWRGIDQNSGGGAYSLSATYQHRSGLFLSASVLGLQGQPSALDQMSVSAGIDIELFDGLTTSLAFSRYGYVDSSVQARSSIHSDASLWLSYSTSLVTPAISIVWAMGDSGNDFFCAWELSRAFALPPFWAGRWLLVPSVSGEYGTISLVRAFATRSRRNPAPQTRVETSSPFVLTNYNFSLAAFCVVGNLTLAPEFVFVVPINVSSFTLTVMGPNLPRPITRAFQRGGKSFGYVSLSVSYSF
ncbi:MAG: hypothetical protein RMM16_08030 [Chloroherpetonaceae bacterium]|nr:hypothetical protein [Chloroherpetonaceae bacterium]